MKILPSNALTSTAEFSRGYFHVVIPNHTRTEDVLKPGFWANFVGRLKPGYLVDVVTEDLELDLQLRVIRVDPGMVVMRPRVGFESDARREEQARAEAAPTARRQMEPEAKVPDGYKVGHNAGLGHYVMLKSTGANVATKLASKAAATRFAIQHSEMANTPGGMPMGPAAAAEGAGASA